MKELEAVLWEFETANIKAHSMDVSLEFWKELQSSKLTHMKPNGEVMYKYLTVNVDPKLETKFRLY